MTTNYHDNEDADERDDDASERDRGTSEREQTRTTTSTSHTRDAMTNLIFSYQRLGSLVQNGLFTASYMHQFMPKRGI